MNNSYYVFAEKNKKRKYSTVSNVIFFQKEMWSFDKVLAVTVLIATVPSIGANYIGNLLPAAIVSNLENSQSLQKMITTVLLLGMLLLISNVWVHFNVHSVKTKREFFDFHLTKKFIKKSEEIDYQLKEGGAYSETYSNAWNSAYNCRGFNEGTQIIMGLTEAIVGITVYGIILGRENLIILFLVLISVGANLYLLSVARKVHRKYFGKISKYAKGISYISDITIDSAAGKDIRIFNMLDFIMKKYDENMNQILSHYGKIHNWYMIRNTSTAVLCFIRDAVAYIYLALALFNGKITAAEFVFLIGAISSLASYFERALRMLMSWNALDSSVTYFRDYLGTKSRWADKSEITTEQLNEIRKNGVELELKDVTYTYEGADAPTISHFNLRINQGEKLALIGLNGAGKTTLVKLICGLYIPDEGSITINGIDRDKFSRKDYQSLISVMFQDSYFLPTTLDENLTGGLKTDEERLRRSLKLSGFENVYDNLDKKGQSHLVKKLEEGAVDFSGGEKQKLIFARALYKDASLVILDEPTAALDPIAEHELYCNFKEAVENRTCIYISHRLSSTRFCDRIILIEDGKIIEEGTHDILLTKNGRYSQLFEMQGKYYQEEQEHKRKLEIMEGGELKDE